MARHREHLHHDGEVRDARDAAVEVHGLGAHLDVEREREHPAELANLRHERVHLFGAPERLRLGVRADRGGVHVVAVLAVRGEHRVEEQRVLPHDARHELASIALPIVGTRILDGVRSPERFGTLTMPTLSALL